jgi:predicted transcriptional regulator
MNISKKIGIKISTKNHHHKLWLEDYKSKDTYNMVIIINAGIGDLFTKKNIDIIHKLLKPGGVLGNIEQRNFIKTQKDIDKYEKEEKKCANIFINMFKTKKFRIIEDGVYNKI